MYLCFHTELQGRFWNPAYHIHRTLRGREAIAEFPSFSLLLWFVTNWENSLINTGLTLESPEKKQIASVSTSP